MPTNASRTLWQDPIALHCSVRFSSMRMVSVDAGLPQPRWLPQPCREAMVKKLQSFSSLVVGALEAKISSTMSREEGHVHLVDISVESSKLSKANKAPGPTTLTGLLCGYPVLYVFEADCSSSSLSKENVATNANCLGMESLSLIAVSMDATSTSTNTAGDASISSTTGSNRCRKSNKRRGDSSSTPQRPRRVCAFSVPKILCSSKDHDATSESSGTKGTPQRTAKGTETSSSHERKGESAPSTDSGNCHKHDEAKSSMSVLQEQKSTHRDEVKRFPLSGDEGSRLRYILRFWNDDHSTRDPKNVSTLWLSSGLRLSSTNMSLPRVAL
uniref:Uncharacterized protein n=2 Tax=Lotharella globosa TaxID=91324 RepID=A0A6V3LPV9_9EUKA|mmetsp:Transcript_4894/g.9600  ORF Transcript_4894/g.9600 Transcript_4894/m.9600 type:complete len:328 (+) Transcript_4894:111-1094(+)